jgi:hypothetical protein
MSKKHTLKNHSSPVTGLGATQLSMQQFLAGDFSAIIERYADSPPKSAKERLVLGVCYRKLEQNKPALDCFSHLLNHQMTELQAENQLDVLDGLTACYLVEGDLSQARHYGTQALLARDQLFQMPVVPWCEETSFHTVSHYKTLSINTAEPQAHLKVLSFCLYGNLAVYLEMMLMNLAAAKVLYPDWQVRIYHDESIPTATLEKFVLNGAVNIAVDAAQKAYPGTMWRFLALEDSSVEWVSFRDADSLLTPREVVCVNEWLASDQVVHAIRDWYTHSEVLLAGMWGAYAPALRSIRTAMNAFIARPFTPSHADQHFLRRYVWPYARTSVCVHDSVFQSTTRAFPVVTKPTLAAHIGNRLSNHFFMPQPPDWVMHANHGAVPEIAFIAQGSLFARYPLLRRVEATPAQVAGWVIEIPNHLRDAIRGGHIQVELRMGKA